MNPFKFFKSGAFNIILGQLGGKKGITKMAHQIAPIVESKIIEEMNERANDDELQYSLSKMTLKDESERIIISLCPIKKVDGKRIMEQPIEAYSFPKFLELIIAKMNNENGGDKK